MVEWISAIATLVTAIATGVLVLVATRQLGQVRNQIENAARQIQLTHEQIDYQREADKQSYTLRECHRYENDIHLKEAMKHLWEKSQNGTNYTLLDDSDKFHVLTMLNYLNGIAYGIEQNLMVESVAEYFIREPLIKAVKVLLKGESGNGYLANKPQTHDKGFEILIGLYHKWTESNTLAASK